MGFPWILIRAPLFGFLLETSLQAVVPVAASIAVVMEHTLGTEQQRLGLPGEVPYRMPRHCLTNALGMWCQSIFQAGNDYLPI